MIITYIALIMIGLAIGILITASILETQNSLDHEDYIKAFNQGKNATKTAMHLFVDARKSILKEQYKIEPVTSTLERMIELEKMHLFVNNQIAYEDKAKENVYELLEKEGE